MILAVLTFLQITLLAIVGFLLFEHPAYFEVCIRYRILKHLRPRESLVLPIPQIDLTLIILVRILPIIIDTGAN